MRVYDYWCVVYDYSGDFLFNRTMDYKHVLTLDEYESLTDKEFKLYMETGELPERIINKQ